MAEPDKPRIEVTLEAASTRLRPILLTTVTTVIGMIPLELAGGTFAPLAFTVMFGLSFALLLTLVLLPTLFYRSKKNTLGNWIGNIKRTLSHWINRLYSNKALLNESK